MKKYEVEYRALLNKEIFGKIYEKGGKISPEGFNKPIIIWDAYFCAESVKGFHEIEMDKVGSYSLRLRQEIKEGKPEVTLNTKIIKNEGDHNAWLEHEIEVSSYEECKSILKAIGFKVFFELKKNRYSFVDGQVNVCLEDIQDFQPSIEVEIITTEEQSSSAKEQLINYLKDNDITEDMIVKKSITNMLMKEKAVF